MRAKVFAFLGKLDPYIAIISLFALLSSVRVWLVRDVIWDDNCWLQILYATSGLREFLDLGFVELRRELLGVALYPLLSLHKSGPFFYAAWHTLDMLTELTSPVLLYLFVKNVLSNRRDIALMAAFAFIACHFDHTLGYASAINYRMGLLLSLVSLYLTERGVAGAYARPACLAGALLSAWLGNYVFMEAMVAIEPARLLLIGYLLSRRPHQPLALLKKTILIAMPFLVLGIFLILFKLLYKPFGLYEGAYAHHFHWRQIARNLASLFYFERRELAQAFHYGSTGSVFAGVGAALLSVWVAKKLSPATALPATGVRPSTVSWLNGFRMRLHAQRSALVIGFAFLLFPAVLLIYADRALGGNMNSSHAAPLQIGWSMAAGAILWASFSAIPSEWTYGRTLGIALLTCFLTVGTFVNNKYLDLYLQSWEAQTGFWQAFQNRFPSLPERATIFFDVDDGVEFSDLRIYYDFEFQMNLLYATDRDPASFHRHRAYTLEEFGRLSARRPGSNEAIERETHFGKERLEPDKFIVVRYRPGELLVNREVLAAHSDIGYRDWLDKDPPTLPPFRSSPLRQRLGAPP